MLVYWFMFLFFAVGAIREQPRPMGVRKAELPLRFGGVVLTCLIGFRYQVGSDWFHYQQIFHDSQYKNFPDLLLDSDPSFEFLNWLAQQAGLSMWAVNLAGAVIFTWGLIRFAESQSRPWLTVLVAIPYLVIVVAMGYVRQGIAIGIMLLAITSYMNSASVLRFAVYVAIAASFHKSAVVVLPFVALANDRGRWLNVTLVVISTILIYRLFVSSAVERLGENYLQAAAESQGASIRIAMCVLPAILFVLRKNYMEFTKIEGQIWRNFSFAAFIALAGLLVSPSTTAVDRISLYIIPLQLAVLSRPRATFLSEGMGTGAIILYSGLIQFTWLTFAIHSRDWIPYRMYFF